MVKYIGSFMTQRIINNKHYGDSSLITRDKFLSEGEIVISNEYGFEGIYILNTRGDVVKIGNRNGGSASGSTDSGSTEYVDAEFVKSYLESQAYTTSAKTAEMLSVIEAAVSALSADYMLHKAQNIIDFDAVNERIDNIRIPASGGSGDFDPSVLDGVNEKIDAISGVVESHISQNQIDFENVNSRISVLSGLTAEHIGECEDSLQSILNRIDRLSGITAEIITEDEVRDIVTEEIAFLVSSADSMFNVLREIADWVSNDSTGSAQLISDVADIKDRLGAAEDDIEALTESTAKISELSASTVQYIERNDADLQELSGRIDAIEIPEIPEPVSDEHIRDIAAQEVSELVSSADSMYQVLQELAEWVENDTTGSAQLINDVSSLKDSVSGLTNDISDSNGRISDIEDGVGVLENAVSGLSETLNRHILENREDIQDLSDRIDNIEIPDIPEPISDEHIQDIAAQEVAKLVSSADSMYQVLQELADWVENDESGSAKLISDVADLNDGLVELSGSVITNKDNINELSAETESLKNLVENLPIPSGSPVDESVIQALKDYIDEKIAAIKHESDHVFLSRTQYYELLASGSVVINGEVHEYSDDIYYCIYDEQVPPTSGESSYDYDEETGMVEISGGTEITDGVVELSNSEIDNDGFVTINNEPIPSGGPDADDDGLLSASNLHVDDNGLVEIPDEWEII